MRRGVLLGEQGVWLTGRAPIQTRMSLGTSAHSHSPEAGVSEEDLQNQNGGQKTQAQVQVRHRSPTQLRPAPKALCHLCLWDNPQGQRQMAPVQRTQGTNFMACPCLQREIQTWCLYFSWHRGEGQHPPGPLELCTQDTGHQKPRPCLLAFASAAAAAAGSSKAACTVVARFHASRCCMDYSWRLPSCHHGSQLAAALLAY